MLIHIIQQICRMVYKNGLFQFMNYFTVMVILQLFCIFLYFSKEFLFILRNFQPQHYLSCFSVLNFLSIHHIMVIIQLDNHPIHKSVMISIYVLKMRIHQIGEIFHFQYSILTILDYYHLLVQQYQLKLKDVFTSFFHAVHLNPHLVHNKFPFIFILMLILFNLFKFLVHLL